MDDSSKVNPDDYSRSQLDEMAVKEGLADVKRYQNKVVVAEAIDRVRAGEDATTVNAELKTSEDQPEQTQSSSTASNEQVAAEKANEPVSEAEKEQRKSIHSVNQGHPRKFDESGNPVYSPEEV